MTNKDEASPRQRQIMEQRWAKAKVECPAGTCVPASRFHIAGCERRQQKILVTNLNTGEVVDATIDHSNPRAVKQVLDQHEKQAVHLEPVARVVDLPNDGGKLLIPAEVEMPEDWSRWERGVFEERFDEDRELHLEPAQLDHTGPGNGQAPARPWWKFWGRRG